MPSAQEGRAEKGEAMTREFEIIYRAPMDTVGQLLTVLVRASVEREARKVIEDTGVAICNVRELRVVIDANQNFFRMEEAVEYLRTSVSGFYELIASGVLPAAAEGKPVYSRRQLDAVALRGMKRMDPQILKEAA